MSNKSEDAMTFQDATIKGEQGYFRVGKNDNGQWWFIDPEGNPFFYRGVCAVNRAGTAGGRRARDGRYAEVVDAKYGYQQHPDTFVYAQLDRLRDWGFNGLGAWTTEEFFNHGMAYTEIMEFFKEGPMLELPGDTRKLPDIFDPEWIQAINSKARTLCAPKRNSRDLIGYFTDNEIGFGATNDFGLDLGFANAGRFGFSMLRSFLSLEAEVPAREKAWEFIYNRYADLASLSEAWGVNIRSEEDIERLNAQKTPIETEAYQKDARDFQQRYVEHYFKVTYETIKRYDPNHLVLGCRFGAPPDSITLKTMAPWVDVVSVNNYRPTLYQRIDFIYRNTNLPVLIGEFSWNPDLFKYVPLLEEPGDGYSIKERVFRKGAKVLLQAATHPAMVGYTWYRWVANTTNDTNFSYGLVNREDQVEMHIPALKRVHQAMVPVRKSIGEKDNATHMSSGEVVLKLENIRPGWNHVLNFSVQDGKWGPRAYGWQMEAKNITGEWGPDQMQANFQLDFKEWYFRGEKALEAGYGTYEVYGQRKGDRIVGRFTGTYEGDSVSGPVTGYFLPDLPSAYQTDQLFKENEI